MRALLTCHFLQDHNKLEPKLFHCSMFLIIFKWSAGADPGIPSRGGAKRESVATEPEGAERGRRVWEGVLGGECPLSHGREIFCFFFFFTLTEVIVRFPA